MKDIRFLTARHIKPWCKCDDDEKLGGCNGLLLAPNVDRLFDRGFISCGDTGQMIVSAGVSVGMLAALGIAPPRM